MSRKIHPDEMLTVTMPAGYLLKFLDKLSFLGAMNKEPETKKVVADVYEQIKKQID